MSSIIIDGLLNGLKNEGGFISGSTEFYSELPTLPNSSYENKLWFVEKPSGGLLSKIGVYKYPAGLYKVNSAGTNWELTPINVKASEDSLTLVNITNWNEFFDFSFDVTIGDRLIYNDIVYRNLTGVITTTSPDNDLTNWERFDVFKLDGTEIQPINDGDNLNMLSGSIKLKDGVVSWNDNEYTLDISAGLGATIQVGQEQLILFYNDTGSTIGNGKILHPVGGTSVSGIIVPTVELADGANYEKCQGTLFVSTSEIPNGSLGFGTTFGKVRGLNTSLLGAGKQVWLACDGSGDFIAQQPQFPCYVISMGGTLNADAVNGEIFVSITTLPEETIFNAFDGSIRETFDFRTTSDGTTITGTLTNPNVDYDDLTCLFSTGFYRFDCPTNGSITLTAGSTTVPQMNYVYILESTKSLTVSTSGFPDDQEHCKVAILALLDAATTQTNGALRNQNTNDHIKTDDDNGHILHMAERLRVLNAEWDSGALANLSGTPTDVYISNTSGKVWQMHKQVFPAQDMALGDYIHVVNDPVTPYRTTTNLNDYTDYSTELTNNNDWSNIVIWGVCNKTGEASHLMVNLPSDGYNTEENAIEDRNNFTNYSIPKEFKGVGFLIARFTIRRSGTTFTYNSGTGYLDLRGFVPNNTAGGSAGSSGITEFTGLTDTPSSYTGQALNILQVNSGETALEFVNGNTKFVDLTTAQTIAGVKTFNSFPVSPSLAPSTDYQFANKKYVDDNAGGSSDNLELDNTTFANQVGVINKNSLPWLHDFNYGDNGTVTTRGRNFFGAGAGNFTLGATATSSYDASSNIGIGKDNLSALTTGRDNISIGDTAGQDMTTGRYNVFIGSLAARNVTDITDSVFIGRSVGAAISSGGHYSSVVGSESGQNMGFGNSVFGYRSLQGGSSVTNFNTTSGAYSLRDISGSSSYNFAGGYNAGRNYGTGSTLRNTSNSVYIGKDARALADGTTNEIVIGANAIGSGANTSTLGDDLITESHIRGELYAPETIAGTGGADLRIDTTTFKIFSDSSSIRYKTITDENPDTSALHNLQTVVYDRKDGSVKGEVGFIAESIAEVFPNLVYSTVTNKAEIKTARVNRRKYFESLLDADEVDKDVLTEEQINAFLVEAEEKYPIPEEKIEIEGYNKADLVPYLVNEIKILANRVTELENLNKK